MLFLIIVNIDYVSHFSRDCAKNKTLSSILSLRHVLIKGIDFGLSMKTVQTRYV